MLCVWGGGGVASIKLFQAAGFVVDTWSDYAASPGLPVAGHRIGLCIRQWENNNTPNIQ